MSHPFCGTGIACPSTFPHHGWEAWNEKAIYVKVTIDDSVTHKLACGAAITRWNEQVGARFLLVEDKGDVEIRFFEKTANEWPFNMWLINGQAAAGFALNYDKDGNMLGTQPGKIVRCDIYIRHDQIGIEYFQWANYYAHEIGHAFGLDDHPKDDINSVMSYQIQGRLLLGPSREDVRGIANIYGLKNLTVRPEDLEGIDNIVNIWHYDRYGNRSSFSQSRWRLWSALSLWFGNGSSLTAMEPYEVYQVKAKQGGMLGFGRFSLPVYADQHRRWMYK